MKRKIFNLVELLSYGMSLWLGAILAAAVVYTRIIGVSAITLSFNNYNEHLIEAIVFPVCVISSFGFFFIRAGNLRAKWEN